MRIPRAELHRSVFAEGDLRDESRPEIAIAGRSNVGKSSLLNRLLGASSLARVSRTPGRTRALHYFLVEDRFLVVDLPGYGYARAARDDREQWGRLIDAYLRRTKPARRVLLLVDAEVGATALDAQAADYLEDLGVAFTVVATKIDKLSRGRRQAALSGIRAALDLGAETPLFAFSSHTGEGARELWRHVEDILAVACAPHETRKEEHA
ncbi:MAG: YihA family ribosome biogenesis GTP-binding protein [Holophagales bacterium]|nr:MAG: YihA family ribosome biogenesis GTP-binding protein [Holophagales bacterium]